jgi:hypothetical protein
MSILARSRAARRIMPIAAAAILALHAPVRAQDVAQLAPPRTFLAVSIPNFASLAAAFEDSELGRLWEEPQIRRFFEALIEDQAEEFNQFLKDVNIQVRDLRPPSGQAGFALFLPEGSNEDPRADDSPHILAVANMGENADDWDDALERLIDHALDQRRITMEDDTYAGVSIRSLKPVYLETNTPRGDDDFDTDEESGGLAGLLGGTSERPRHLHIARIGQTFIACTELGALEAAIDELSGTHRESIADLQHFSDAAAMRPAGEHAYAVFLPEPLLKSLEEESTEFSPLRMLGAMGFTTVKAVGMGLRLSTPDATAELSMGLLAPERTGVLGLLLPAPRGFEPPSFIPAHASDVWAIHFDFAGIPDLYRSIARTMPREQERQMIAAFDQISNILVPTLEAMGPGIHYMTVYAQPLSAESEMQTVAIELKDQTIVANTLTFLMGMAQGVLEARDFEGNTIYSSQVVPAAIGIGFNRAFIGSVAGVENAMRLAGSPDGPGGGARITDERAFRDAARNVAPGAIAYTWSDMEQTLRWGYWTTQNQMAILEAQFREFGWPEEELNEFINELREERAKWLDHLPPLDLLTRSIGDMVSEFHATPEGFRSRTLLLKPSSR